MRRFPFEPESPDTRLFACDIPVAVLFDARLDRCEVKWGFEHRWMSDTQVVEFYLLRLKAGHSLDAAEERLALLLPDDVDLVGEILDDATLDCSEERAARVWEYLVLDHIHEHQGEFENVWETVANAAADFQFPPELKGLVYFFPPPLGEEVGYPAMMRRWEAFLESRSREIEEREDWHPEG